MEANKDCLSTTGDCLVPNDWSVKKTCSAFPLELGRVCLYKLIHHI